MCRSVGHDPRYVIYWPLSEKSQKIKRCINRLSHSPLKPINRPFLIFDSFPIFLLVAANRLIKLQKTRFSYSPISPLSPCLNAVFTSPAAHCPILLFIVFFHLLFFSSLSPPKSASFHQGWRDRSGGVWLRFFTPATLPFHHRLMRQILYLKNKQKNKRYRFLVKIYINIATGQTLSRHPWYFEVGSITFHREYFNCWQVIACRIKACMRVNS